MPQSDSHGNVCQWLESRGFPAEVDAAVILGSGLGGFTSVLTNPVSILYEHIPGFPQTSVEGHSGTLWCGTIEDKKVMLFAGRFHHYEGHPFERTILPIRLSAAMGAKLLVISNAAGAINPRFRPGDLMLIDDLMCIGFPTLPAGELHDARFSSDSLVTFVRNTALSQGIDLKQGTYCYVKGPVYETKAEIRAFSRLGADVVGMSTYSELIEAQRLGLGTIGISLITNMSTGYSSGKLDHSDIQEVAGNRERDFGNLVSKLIGTYVDRGK